tara:strand:+ start:1429 stop:4260 length:2832 start_codon:yes stop_codon:yes gene_type:complete
MAAPTIPNGEEHFFPIIYEGNGAGQKVGNFVPFTDQATVANSCLIQPVAQRRLGRTPSSNGSGTTLTFSVWIKRSEFGSTIRQIFIANDYASVGEALEFNTSNQLNYYCIKSAPGSYDWNYVTNRTFEDTSKWYHIMVARDTTDSTQADRIKIYVDGERITDFATESQSALNRTGWMNQTTYENTFGNTNNASIVRGIGYLAEMNMIDGQALLPASFGITDTSTGRWIPKTVEPFPTTTTTYTVTVVGGNPSNHPYHNVGSTNKYAIDGSTATADVTLTLIEGATYKFDQSDSSNSGHPLRFSTTANGTHGGGTEYTTGVTTVGTPGSSGAYTEITVATGAPTLYYYCTNHSAMGWTANTQDQYGTNGFRCKFQDSSALGDDTSGKGNDLTATGMSTTNQTTDSPTQNFATGLGGFQTSYAMAMSEGNLKSEASGGQAQHGKSQTTLSFDPSDSNGYYAEYTVNSTSSVGSNFNVVGITAEYQKVAVPSASYGNVNNQVQYYEDGRVRFTNSAGTRTDIASWGSTWGNTSTPDIIGIFVKNNKIYFSKNGTWQGSADPDNETGGLGIEGTIGSNRVGFHHTGYRSSSTYGTMTANFGQKSFTYTPPTGYKKLNQDNLPETAKGISGSVWIKNRDATDSWIWQDSLRGKSEYGSPATATQYNSSITDGVKKFLKGGVQIEDNVAVNTSGESYVAFNWVLNNGTNVTDTSGDLSTELQANPTAGVSVGKFTVSGSGNKTWAHGLDGVPEVGILCAYSSTNSGTFYHHKISTTPYSSGLFLINSNSAFTSSNIWGSAKPTSTLWTGLVGSLFSAGQPYIFYSFRGIEGFSKFGSYTGNGSADGSFIYTGFRPAWLMIKRTNSAANWYIIDTKRDPINPTGQHNLNADTTSAESSNAGLASLDILSNGFKNRQGAGTGINDSGSTYIYMAFAEHPFVGDGTSPVTAR